MRQRARSIQWLVAAIAMLWTPSASAQEPTATELAWDQVEVSATVLELNAILATASFDAPASGEDEANAGRAVAHAERLAAEVEELAARLAAGESRESTRELMIRIQNRRALLAEMGSEAPAFLAPEDAAAAFALWNELRAYYRPKAAAATVEVTE